MADIKSKEARSYNMSKIKRDNTGPEVFIRKGLFSRGFRYRNNSPKILGRPDIWMAKYNLAIFINGCFWHRHQSCKFAYTPKSNVEFWNKKFEQNIARDKRIKDELLKNGMRVLIIWECTIRKMKKSKEYNFQIFDTITDFIKSDSNYAEI